MSKKNYRPTLSARKKVEEQKLAKKTAKRVAFWQQYKKQIIIAAAAAVAAIIVLALAIDYFYMPAGSLRTFMGKPTGYDETSIIRGMGKHYFELAKLDTPDGYTAADYGMNISNDSFEQYRYFQAADETKQIKTIYACGVEEKTGDDMLNTLVSSGLYENYSPKNDAEIAGHQIDYLYATSPEYDDNSELTGNSYAMLVMYADSVRDSCVLINCSTSPMLPEELPTEEQLLAEAEAILSKLQLP